MRRFTIRLSIIVGTIGLIVLASHSWLLILGILFLSFFIWLAANDINKDDSPYTSSYSSYNHGHKVPKSPLEYSSSPHYIQQKAKHIADLIRKYVDNVIDNKKGLIDSSALFSFWGVNVSEYKTLHKRHLDNLLRGLQKLGYGVVPDYQHGHKRLEYNEACVLYRSPADHVNITTKYVEIFWRLYAVLLSGQKMQAGDVEYIDKCMAVLSVPAQSHAYLRAYILWLTQKKQPYDKKTKDEVALLSSEIKKMFANLLTDAVSVNGNIDSSRMEALKKILPTLDAEASSVHSLVHQSLTNEGFATIETRKGVVEHTIRQPEQKKTATLVLDERKLEELKQQTEVAQGLLSDIFIEDDEEMVTVNQTNDSLIEILKKLLEKDIWQRSEVMDLLGPGEMLGNILERINDYSYSIVEDIVVEEDGQTIYVTTEYKEQLI